MWNINWNWTKSLRDGLPRLWRSDFVQFKFIKLLLFLLNHLKMLQCLHNCTFFIFWALWLPAIFRLLFQLGQKNYRLYMPWVCNKDAHPLAFSLSLGFKNDATIPYRTCKNKHNAPLCTCHRIRLDLFLRYKPDCLCVIYTLLFPYGTFLSV